MKGSSSSGWMHRGNRDKLPHALDTADLNMPNLHHPPTTPTYTTPRFAPEPPVSKGFKLGNVFGRRAASPAPSSSFPSASSLPPSSASLQSGNHHPYSSVGPSPVPVVSSPDALEDEEECPVCLEPLSFSFRLPGEKPHIVPECGHSLHEVSAQIFSYSAITLRALMRLACRRASLPYMGHLQGKRDLVRHGNRILAYVVFAGDL